MEKTVLKVIGGGAPTDGANDLINSSEPYQVCVTICGSSDYLFHAWNIEALEAQANAPKGSKLKKSDDLESYVYRSEDGTLGIPGEQLRMSIVNAARYRQDPRSPRKSAMDLYKAGLVTLTPVATVGKINWDYDHKARVVIQRNSITRTRPALKAGYTATFDIQVLLAEYINPIELNEVISKAGVYCGIGDFRPTYGRFQIVNFTVK